MLDRQGRAFGYDVESVCDCEGCTNIMQRDYLHTCMRCGLFFCWEHIGLSDLGLLCDQCYKEEAEVESP